MSDVAGAVRVIVEGDEKICEGKDDDQHQPEDPPEFPAGRRVLSRPMSDLLPKHQPGHQRDRLFYYLEKVNNTGTSSSNFSNLLEDLLTTGVRAIICHECMDKKWNWEEVFLNT